MGEQSHEFFFAAVCFGQAVRTFPLGYCRLAFREIVHHPDE